MAAFLPSKVSTEAVQRRWLCPVDDDDGASTVSTSATGVTVSAATLEGDELITADSPRPDAFSFHFYGGGSLRCGNMGQSAAKALSAAWLDSVDPAIARVKDLRDRTAPGAPLWNTESAEAACGGNPWAASFADSFRFVDTLGRSALQGVRVFMHNTLAASDYALLDEHGYKPRPNYWATSRMSRPFCPR